MVVLFHRLTKARGVSLVIYHRHWSRAFVIDPAALRYCLVVSGSVARPPLPLPMRVRLSCWVSMNELCTFTQQNFCLVRFSIFIAGRHQLIMLFWFDLLNVWQHPLPAFLALRPTVFRVPLAALSFLLSQRSIGVVWNFQSYSVLGPAFIGLRFIPA